MICILSAFERDARANARDFLADAESLRRQAARQRQPRKRATLAKAESFEFEAASWAAKAEHGEPTP